jgi:hypothetical protein
LSKIESLEIWTQDLKDKGRLTYCYNRHLLVIYFWVIKFMYLLELLPRLHLKFLWIYSKFYPNLNSSSSLNSNLSKLNPNSNLGWGPYFFSYWFYSKYCPNSNWSLNLNFSEFIPNPIRIQILLLDPTTPTNRHVGPPPHRA